MTKTAIIQAQQRWEYLNVVKRTDAALAAELNEQGQSGWELVSVIYGKDRKGELAWTGFLKRPATQPPSAGSASQPVATAQPSQEAEKAGTPESSEGFDLSGDEFELKE